MDKTRKLFEHYTKALMLSGTKRAKILALTRALAESDPQGLMKYELSFKLKGAKLLPAAGITSMDANAYSCKSSSLFLSRLDTYRRIIAENIQSAFLGKVIDALREVAKTPMDLYFGMDIENGESSFGFCLILGGAGKNGKVRYCPYDCNRIIRTLLRNLGCKAPSPLRKNIFHMSIKIDKHGIYYELYYEGVPLFRFFSEQKRDLRKRLCDYEHHFCSSESYRKGGSIIDRSIFVYVPYGPFTDGRSLGEFLGRLQGAKVRGPIFSQLTARLRLVPGQLTLARFDRSDILTLYLTAAS